METPAVKRTANVLTIVLCTCASLAVSSCRERPPPAVARSIDDPHPLLGKSAPAFVTVDPDGRAVDLNKHLGKNVIMLDFWATWCGPCILAMPDVASVAKKFEDRGLVLYAVNVGEDPDTVKEFLAELKLDVPVAMDFRGQIQKSYQAHGLPHTILVGKDGKVQVAHLGYRDDMAERLSDDVEKLLAGKDLASETLADAP
jgi:thiol-disulfide isomerase/thioredoxin